MGKHSESDELDVIGAIRAGLITAAESRGYDELREDLDLKKTTFDRLFDKRPDSGGISARTLLAVCKSPEVRLSLGSALLPEIRGAEKRGWAAVTVDLRKMLSLPAAWNLLAKLREMKKLGILNDQFHMLDGVIRDKKESNAKEAIARKAIGKPPKTKTG